MKQLSTVFTGLGVLTALCLAFGGLAVPGAESLGLVVKKGAAVLTPGP